jgi:hypothetical protein
MEGPPGGLIVNLYKVWFMISVHSIDDMFVIHNIANLTFVFNGTTN